MKATILPHRFRKQLPRNEGKGKTFLDDLSERTETTLPAELSDRTYGSIVTSVTDESYSSLMPSSPTLVNDDFSSSIRTIIGFRKNCKKAKRESIRSMLMKTSEAQSLLASRLQELEKVERHYFWGSPLAMRIYSVLLLAGVLRRLWILHLLHFLLLRKMLELGMVWGIHMYASKDFSDSHKLLLHQYNFWFNQLERAMKGDNVRRSMAGASYKFWTTIGKNYFLYLWRAQGREIYLRRVRESTQMLERSERFWNQHMVQGSVALTALKQNVADVLRTTNDHVAGAIRTTHEIRLKANDHVADVMRTTNDIRRRANDHVVGVMRNTTHEIRNKTNGMKETQFFMRRNRS